MHGDVIVVIIYGLMIFLLHFL